MDEVRRRGIVRTALVAMLGLQLAAFELVVLTGQRFLNFPGPRLLLAVLIAVPFATAIVLLLVRSSRWRNLEVPFLLMTLALTFRFHSPAFFERIFPDTIDDSVIIAAVTSPTLVQYLRELAAAQEQHRRIRRRYARQVGELVQWVKPPDRTTVTMTSRADSGWTATASLEGITCRIWVRDSSMRRAAGDIEGSPECGRREERSGRHEIRSVFSSAPESGFLSSDIRDQWVQHRASANRIGTSPGSNPGSYTWTTRIAGPIRGSAAIAGGQVFVGAHGNGEFAAISLSSGKLGYRVRAPNWVHHEPVVGDSLVMVGFGNNEPSPIGKSILGSPPSGVVAYDRTTGTERWRRYTRGSVMTSPVLDGHIVAAITGSSEAFGWSIANGREVWRATLPDHAPMGNPALAEGLMIFGVEPATVCAIAVATGRRRYCTVLDIGGWGAGHASVAVAGNVALQVYENDVGGWGAKRDGRLAAYARRFIGLPPKRHAPDPTDALREQVMVALRVGDGRELWRVGLGRGTRRVPGHIAGTPTIEAGVAYLPSPTAGAVVAVNIATGRIIWSSPVSPSRGSVLVASGKVFAATSAGTVVLDARTGAIVCRQSLPAAADRAGPAVSGGTGVLTLVDGTVMARPLETWLSCAA